MNLHFSRLYILIIYIYIYASLNTMNKEYLRKKSKLSPASWFHPYIINRYYTGIRSRLSPVTILIQVLSDNYEFGPKYFMKIILLSI